MRRGGSLFENLRTNFNGSINQHQPGYTLIPLPSCSNNGGHLWVNIKLLSEFNHRAARSNRRHSHFCLEACPMIASFPLRHLLLLLRREL